MGKMNVDQFLKLKENQKYTMWWFGNFGFPTYLQIKLVSVECREYAQYEKTIRIKFTRKGGRNVYEINFVPGEAVIFWQGWIAPNAKMCGDSVEGVGIGVTVNRSKYLSYDRRYLADALASIATDPVVVER